MARRPGLSAADTTVGRGIPASVGAAGPTAYHRLNPLTKAAIATATAVTAVVLGGVVPPLIVVAIAVLVPALLARILWRLVLTSLVVALPLAGSAFLVNLFFFPGGDTELFELGPFEASAEGLAFALEILVRIVAIGGAITLFYLTTPPASFVVDLERRGVSPRLAFVANASVQTVPALVDRAVQITAAQRARGLDTQGSPLKRIRGLLPLVGPVILGSISEVEERTMALEARGFTRPGRRTLLWSPPDSGWQRIARWLILAIIIGLIAARLSGVWS